jgi:hypothetical protein
VAQHGILFYRSPINDCRVITVRDHTTNQRDCVDKQEKHLRHDIKSRTRKKGNSDTIETRRCAKNAKERGDGTCEVDAHLHCAYNLALQHVPVCADLVVGL